MFKKVVIFIIKIALAAACLVIIYRSVDFSDVPSILKSVNVTFLAIAYLLIFAETYLMAIRLKILFKSKDIIIKFNNLVRVIFVSLFISSSMPSSIGADALRIILLKRQNYSITHSTSVMVMDRILSVFAMLVFSLIGMLLIFDHIPDTNLLLIFLALLISSAILFLCFISNLPQLVLERISSVSTYMINSFSKNLAVVAECLKKSITFVSGIHKSFADFVRNPLDLLKVFSWNALNQVLRVLQVHFIFLAIGHVVFFQYEFAFVPIIMLLTLLPITYFGIGIREGAFLYFFSLVNVPEAVSLSASMLFSMLIVCGILPGVVLFFLNSKS